MTTYLIGLDFGSESARGVLVEVESGQQVGQYVHPYRHGIMTRALPDGTRLPSGFALQNAEDYTEAAFEILSRLGRGRVVEGIGLGFTASSPLPARADGVPLSRLHPAVPHAYVKLWKHNAQAYADAINARSHPFLANFGGRVSGEWLLAKAAQIAAEAPAIWAETDRFIESGDWLVWQLTGREARGLGFAAYKAQFSAGAGYPQGIVADLDRRLANPLAVGSPAGSLSAQWRDLTGIEGRATVAVAVIDSHVMLPAIGGTTPGAFIGALGTSAAYLYLSDIYRPLPPGIEGVAFDGSMRQLWCYEAGQPSFGDTLAWFARTFPRGADIDESFRAYNAEAAALAPAAGKLVALDWLGGNRVPYADGMLSGLLAGLTRQTTAAEIYLALMEGLCFGARAIFDLFPAGGLAPERVLMSSGLARANPLLIQIMADVLDHPVEVPEIANATAVGAAIHGAVAAGTVASYAEGAERFGARSVERISPREPQARRYQAAYDIYRGLSGGESVHAALHALRGLESGAPV
ncbi:FGGY-family carbohydrate kinase [Sinorhizobium sp. RAC02]|uniref:FGGY-family carbohydrate kinase n=1 Tax=Sinorhizobium sp. RAC02 TaxID=1842534 RepID=UPI000857FFF7|nr:FGGY-family carbohydrate kinase [Sinorhizobium sp. RAC02]AOF94397.1 carbohydrate kinase, FGGY family [Sinorhizobium sp. RAC02]